MRVDEHQDHGQALVEQVELVGYGRQQEIHGTQTQDRKHVASIQAAGAVFVKRACGQRNDGQW
jgi:hypothetical protein